MKKYSLLLLLLFLVSAYGQKKPAALKITYLKSSNGTAVENQDPVWVYTAPGKCLIASEKIIGGKSGFPSEQTFVNFDANSYSQLALLGTNKCVMTTDSTSMAKQNLELLPDTKKILGYTCKKAKTIINSNTIEIWYTNELELKGGPSVLGQNLGLVLEVMRNGNYQVLATKIEKLKAIPAFLSLPKTKTTDLLTYRDLLWKSRFTDITVFDKEIINFSPDSKSNDSILRFANGTIIVKKVRFPEIRKGSQIFTDVTEQSNGDAYDRTGSVFVIPTDKDISFLNGLKDGIKTLPVYENGNGKQYQGVVRTKTFTPLLELMRFFTPFGVKQYNSIQQKNKAWQDSVIYRQDISDLRTVLSGREVYIGMNIGNYDKGGHRASLHISIHPEAESTVPETVVLPLFNSNNVMEMAGQEYATMFNSEKGLEATFEIPENLKNAKLRYITTGHGGWENGDEFLQKKNTILLDNKEVFSFTPWRTDCGSYRLSNPASGNFENGLSSSDYSRSNWCPGTVTNPILIDLGNLSAGTHTIRIKIPQGAPEGNSFSSWNVSGVLIGEK